ncbi:MAG: translation initiation factor IF-2 associated domain-containing protein, partial [Alphaproteobacteria bacterium]|nr:translation initiation factor IF-2 associated domain-containing protein [Alphaproteobacteria bacterium]
MSESDNQDRKTPLKLSQPGKLELKKTVESGQVRQSFSHGRSKVVTVEVRKKRTFTADAGGAMHEVRGQQAHSGAEAELAKAVAIVEAAQQAASAHDLTNHEKVARAKALETAMKVAEDARLRAEEEARIRAEEEARAAIEAAEQAAIEAEEAANRPEPEAGAHRNPDLAMQNLGTAIDTAFADMAGIDGGVLRAKRRDKFLE